MTILENIDINKAILENINIGIDIDKDIFENIDIDIDKDILENVDINWMQSADMPTNRFVYIPNPAGPEMEIVWDNISRSNTVAKAYIQEKCDKKDNVLKKNLNQQQ